MDPSSATQPITRPTPIRRGRSYRKPAPIYVPSPTASPDVPAKRLSITSSREGPPVPPQWRDVIEAALADIGAGLTPTFEYHQNRSSNIMQEIRSLDSNEVIMEIPLSYLPDVPSDVLESPSYSAPPLTPKVQANSPNSRRRTLPQDYRPPTPPLPTHHRQRRASPNGPSTANLTLPGRLIYPDSPSTIMLPDNHMPDFIPESMRPSSPTPTGVSVSTTRKSSSFKTTKSKSSFSIDRHDDWYFIPALSSQKRPGDSTARKPSSKLLSPFIWVWEIWCRMGRAVLVLVRRPNREPKMCTEA